jgi:hypothetical protein
MDEMFAISLKSGQPFSGFETVSMMSYFFEGFKSKLFTIPGFPFNEHSVYYKGKKNDFYDELLKSLIKRGWLYYQ